MYSTSRAIESRSKCLHPAKGVPGKGRPDTGLMEGKNFGGGGATLIDLQKKSKLDRLYGE